MQREHLMKRYVVQREQVKQGSVSEYLIGCERMKGGKFQAPWNKCENEVISMSRAWDKEKIWVPDRIRTYDLLNTGRALYPLELRRTQLESEAIY